MNKAVFVTGGQNGTGYAIADFFARNGMNVFIGALDEKEATAAAQRISDTYGVYAKGYECNLLNEGQINSVFDQIEESGHFIDSLVLNAADMALGDDPSKGLDVWTLPLEVFNRVIKTNIAGNFAIARRAALKMREHHHGSIVFIGSNTAYRANENREAYIASKGGINALSKCLAVDFGPYGIRSNVILPGTIKTERWVRMGNKQIVNGEMTPLGDISDFEDIANAAWYLGTDLSKNVTGAELIVDGGMSCQLYPPLLNELKALRDSLEENR
jgi:NAD(P)-dependent dehydrogenase (short-subunit alcohol dehydrogenase family)